MQYTGLIALTIAVIAVLALLVGANDPWFFSLLAMACLLQGAREAYQEHHATAVACLVGGAFFAGAAFRGLFKGRAAQQGGT
ncbi:hypothetical protein LXH13_06385 [Streptomyces spinosirectus]|jgi:hypothetical protein|uniref:hypothetical protein n=1 Tax=Streptomyces TaxID=1883 RepID=UPI001C9DAB61|nr:MULTISPECIES: hypothetical protein [Streptomyces]MBY8341967.1 hypothetical protein [Streptomyces plumbidurans]UIR16684.1 hypothetical protein LXH13_06385 [Streptomyces spinosirectus]